MVNDFYTFTDASKNLNIKLYDNEEKIDAITSSKSFRGRTILGNGVMAISTTPPRINRLDILIKVQCLHCPKKFKNRFFTNQTGFITYHILLNYVLVLGCVDNVTYRKIDLVS